VSFTLRTYRDADLPALRSVLEDPAIVAQFDMYEGDDGAERLLGDPFTPADGVSLAFVGGEPAGFACAILIPSEPPWSMLRGGVLPGFRRRGIGTALHRRTADYVRTQTRLAGVRDLATAAWQPLEIPTAFAEHLGYRHDRWFWLMRRERGGRSPEPTWPAGITVRAFDDSDAMLADYQAAYHDSFASHYRFTPASLAELRAFTRKPGFRTDGVLLAYRDGRPVGFCRNELFASRGEIGTLGTVHTARGIGLGRALLRWGVAWLERETPHAVTLLVDGENESALALYRSEGFEVARTRRIWAQPVRA